MQIIFYNSTDKKIVIVDYANIFSYKFDTKWIH